MQSLLKISKLDANAVLLKREKVFLHDLAKKALQPLEIPMELRKQTITVSGEQGLWMRVDLAWTTEALTNILKNCMEHTGVGGHIQISFQQNPLYTEIRISDDGEGISPNDLPHIFERFYKGKNSSADSVGIGLFLAKSIIQKQFGDIRVESKKESGTEFLIRFYKMRI